MPKKSNKDEFVLKSKLIHGDEYDYSYVEYLSSSIKVNIICFKHGEFSVTPNNHISKKSGCPKCYGKIKMSKSDFINRSNITHNNKYDYSRVDYKSCETEVDIICPEHGLLSKFPIHILGEWVVENVFGNLCFYLYKTLLTNQILSIQRNMTIQGQNT